MPSPEPHSPPPRLAFVLPWRMLERGGVNTVVRHLMIECRREADPVLVELDWNLTPAPQGQLFGFPHLPLRLRSPSPRILSWNNLAYLLLLPYTLAGLARFLKSAGIAHVNLHFVSLAALNFVLLRRCGLFQGKTILSFHGGDAVAACESQGIVRGLWKFVLRNADAVVTCSNPPRRALEALEGKCAGKTAVIPNAIDEPIFLEDDPGYEFPFPVSGSGPLLLSVGRHGTEKGHDVLIRAMPGVLRRYPQAHLLIAGAAGPTLETSRQLARDLGIESKVQLECDVAYPHGISRLMRRAALFVFPSRQETFGLALLEAGLCALPVVASRAGGIPEIIEDGVSGRLCAVDDSEGLEAAIIWALDHPDESRQMGKKLQADVRTRFSWRRTWEGYRQLIDR